MQVGRRLLAVLAAAFGIGLPPGSAEAQDLYRKGHGLITRSGDTCETEVKHPDIQLNVSFLDDEVMIVILGDAFHFPQKTGRMYLRSEEAGVELKLGSASYMTLMIVSSMPFKAADELFSRLVAKNAKTLELLDGKHKLLAVIPFSGFKPAYKAWIACVKAL